MEVPGLAAAQHRHDSAAPREALECPNCLGYEAAGQVLEAIHDALLEAGLRTDMDEPALRARYSGALEDVYERVVRVVRSGDHAACERHR